MKIRIICGLIVSVLTLGLFSGCGGKKIDMDIDKSISDETIEYKLFAHELNAFAGEDRILKTIEDKFNIKLTLDGAPANGWMEKLCLLINADDSPDLFFFIPNDFTYSSSYFNFVDKQMILPLSPFMSEEDTPTLKKLFSTTLYKDLKIEDQYYFVPAPTFPTNHAMYVRKDWLKNLNMAAPTTIDEYTQMLKAFTENDPDQNGKKDTYGLSASKVFEWLNNFKASFGVKPGWEKINGTWTLDAFTNGYKDFLKWFSDIYSKGYMKEEFYLYDDSEAENDFIQGKAGCYITNGDLKVSGIYSKIKQVNSAAEIDFLPMPDGKGKGGFVGTGSWWGGWSISYKAKEPMRLVKLLDYLMSPEGSMLRLCGIENIHYTLDANGEVVPNYEERIKEGDKKFPMGDDNKPRSFYSFGCYFGGLIDIEGEKVTLKNIKSIYTVPDLTAKAWEMTNKNLVYQYPATGMELPTEFSKTSMKITDKVNVYSVRIVAGNIGLEEGLKKMFDESKGVGYESLQKMLKDSN